MISPKDQKIIQIDITNACVHKCSNCTRFCGHHKKTFFMDFENFKNAVDSLDGYEGCVGVIGGEPTLHPEFEKFADYIKEKRLKYTVKNAREPIADMQEYILKHFIDFDHSKAGLWSSLNKSYYKHFETINDSFEAQNCNDHNNTCLHQALLMARKDIGIDDEEWIQKRDNCWIQNTWSATITPKGAFFCEVAGALDMLFDGSGGWKVEQGWWKREPKDFEDQLHWCELCSGCLDVPKRLSNDGKDDISEGMAEKLIAIGSPKMQQGLYVIHTKEDYQKNKISYKTFVGPEDYILEGNSTRTSKENRDIYPRTFSFIEENELPETIKSENPQDWIILSKENYKSKNAQKYFSDLVINPGCLYEFDGLEIFNVKARSIRDYIKNPDSLKGISIKSRYPQDKIIQVKKVDVLKKQISKQLRKIFSLTNKDCHKVINIAGIKIKIKRKDKCNAR